MDLVLIPLWLLVKMVVLAVASIRRRPNPPRGVFEIEGNEARVLFRDRSTGELTRFKFPRTAMFEARVNRFEKGFWLSLPRQIKSTFLQDVPRKSLLAFDAEIQAVRSRHAPPGASATPAI